MADFNLQWSQFGAAVTAVGAFGVAAFGLVESVGKAFAFNGFGLPYAGFGAVKKAIRHLGPALKVAYGDDYMEIISHQYRAGRSTGQAPDTIRQGVRLGLPFMSMEAATAVIDSVWDIDAPGAPKTNATALAAALQAVPPVPPPPSGGVEPQALAGRFATALDARVQAAFEVGEEHYEALAKLIAGMAAVGLAVGFDLGLGVPVPLPVALIIGIVAVPLAPVAKDVSSAMQNTLTAFKSITGKP
ncbi:MAG TPA: hypothetical protein VGM25_01530 [Caulobacteraceae bacterium]|jgi:hypothetical protein